MKWASACAILLTVLLAVPVLAQRSMKAGHAFGGRGGVFVGAGAGGRIVPRPGVIIRQPRAGIVIRTTPSGRFHHGLHRPFHSGSICFHNPSLCRSKFGAGPFIKGGWYGYWPGYAWPYVVTYPDTYNEQVQATLAQQQQRIAELEEQIRQEQLKRMEAEAAQPSPAPAAPIAVQNSNEKPVTPTVLVFRDRQRLEVSNYAIVGDTLYELTQRWTRKISLADLDLPATVQANEERGLKFEIPSSHAQVITRP